MKERCLALLLDSAPPTWTSQEDRHLLLCRELFARGVKPLYIFAAQLRPDIEQRFLDAGATLAYVSFTVGILGFYRELKRLFKEHEVSIVHIIFFDYFSPVMWIVRAAGAKQIIYEMQNSGIFKATSWKRLLLRARTKIMTAPAKRIIAISKFVKEQLVKAGVAEEKIVVRYLGVDCERFVPKGDARAEWVSRYGLEEDALIMSSVSYLRAFKNPQVLVAICKELKNRGVPARLFVAGDGDMLPDLKTSTKELGVDDYLTWLGNVDDPKPLLQASDVFLLVSTGEAFGLVLAEAMACEVPVVGTNSGSLPEVVDDGVTGMLAPPFDAKSLAAAIESLHADKVKLQQMSERALERARKCFSLELAVSNTLAVYDGMKSST
jgi:glycosyltransferase involved in cell wall biosynthesis